MDKSKFLFTGFTWESHIQESIVVSTYTMRSAQGVLWGISWCRNSHGRLWLPLNISKFRQGSVDVCGVMKRRSFYCVAYCTV